MRHALIAAVGLAMASGGAVAQDAATQEVRQRIVNERLHEACVRLYAQDPTSTIVLPTCYQVFLEFGLPD